MSKVYLNAYDNNIKAQEIFTKCGKENCKNKAVIHVNLPTKIKGLKVDNIYPLCREHLEKLYNENFFSYSITNINHMKMIEGIIKYGSIEKWIEEEKESSK